MRNKWIVLDENKMFWLSIFYFPFLCGFIYLLVFLLTSKHLRINKKTKSYLERKYEILRKKLFNFFKQNSWAEGEFGAKNYLLQWFKVNSWSLEAAGAGKQKNPIIQEKRENKKRCNKIRVKPCKKILYLKIKKLKRIKNMARKC